MRDSGLAVVGKYRILDLVGEGAMGVVYRGVDTVLNRTVALKVMSESVARQQDLRDRFLREAQAAGSLQHPNVVTIYDFGEVDGHLYIAMEYVDGMDLERMLAAHEPLTIHQRLDIAIDVLNGLSFAHRHGIVHRDVKPANIRITEEGRAKVMDFGVAYLDSSSLTKTGMMMGTPSYMAPEQVVGGKISPATDIFAMGSVLYELLTGARPFEGNTLHNTLYKIVSEEPPPIRDVMPGLPGALDRIVRKALAKDPESRYKGALEMADELAAVRAELDSEKRTTSTLSLRRSMETAIAQRTQKRSKRRTYAMVAGLVLLVSGAAATAVMLGDGDQEPDSQPIAMAPPESAAGATLPNTAASDSVGPAEDTVAAQLPAPDTAADTLTPQRQPERPSARRQAEASSRTPPPVTRRVDSPVVRSQAVDTSSRQASTTDSLAMAANRAQPRDTPALRSVIDTPRTVVTAPAPVPQRPAEPPAISDSTLIGRTLQAYAQAIESRDVDAVRRAYPGLTAAQQRGWQQFFEATRSLDVTLRINRLQITGSAADAAVVGTYDYATSRGGQQAEPVSFSATLRKENGAWKLVEVR